MIENILNRICYTFIGIILTILFLAMMNHHWLLSGISLLICLVSVIVIIDHEKEEAIKNKIVENKSYIIHSNKYK